MANYSKIIKKQKRETVLIAVPVHSTMEVETVKCLFNLLITTQDVSIQINFRTGTLIDRARCALSDAALENPDITHLLFIDGDMVFPPDSLKKLLSHKKDIVTAFATSRNFRKVIPVIGRFKYDDEGNLSGIRTILQYPKDSLFPIESCGMAMTLITTKALRQLKEREPGRGLFQQIPLKSGGTLPEDSSFCWRAKQAGIPIFCDSSLSIGHKGPYIFTEMDYEAQFKDELIKQFGDALP